MWQIWAIAQWHNYRKLLFNFCNKDLHRFPWRSKCHRGVSSIPIYSCSLITLKTKSRKPHPLLVERIVLVKFNRKVTPGSESRKRCDNLDNQTFSFVFQPGSVQHVGLPSRGKRWRLGRLGRMERWMLERDSDLWALRPLWRSGRRRHRLGRREILLLWLGCIEHLCLRTLTIPRLEHNAHWNGLLSSP